MSAQRRHDKTPSKQYVPIHAAVGGYGGFPSDQFDVTARTTTAARDSTLPQLNSTFSRLNPLPEDRPPQLEHNEIANR